MDAIRTVMRYMAGGKYSDLRELAESNYRTNELLELRYGSWMGMETQLQMPEQLACSVDMATGTGKSYVLYGVAAILLAEGIVDRVLVLCPSNTIESGLLEKFRDLAGNGDLREVLPKDAKITVPRIANASETIVEGSICVENYHAILKHVKSSIRESLIGKGSRVAVLNDEAHHVANETGSNIKRWKEFLLSAEYGFRYVLGVSGTCYTGDRYFTDVISRYSLRQAIEERFVKVVRYVSEMPLADDPEEKWQLVHSRHEAWKRELKHRGIRPLTIVVTRDIRMCKQVAEDVQGFLEESEGLDRRQAAAKVLAVTSAREHQANIAKLKSVDRPESKVEWIVSVSMLNEGWDVKNVFQIVPHEERAFNSKLLIAQVLGRGLRRPDEWQGDDPVVTVFNHDSWAGRIRHLVNEILELERRLGARVLEDTPYHFELHNLNYVRETDTAQFPKSGEYRLLRDGYVELPSQVINEEVTVEYETAVTGEHTKFRTNIAHKTYSFEAVADEMYRRLQSIDEESKDADDPADRTKYTRSFTRARCVDIVKASARRAGISGGRLTEENRQKVLQALGPLRRRAAKRVVYTLAAKMLIDCSTRELPAISCSAIELRRGDRTAFIPPHCEGSIADEQLEFFREVVDPDGEFRAGCEILANSHDFKTPCNLVIADSTPERRIVRQLCERQNAVSVDAWIKNSPQRYYSIEYAWKKGEHPKRGEFSPDFFVKAGDLIFVLEIKDDSEISEPSVENLKKYEYAQAHFGRLNTWLEEAGVRTRYQHNWLSPRSYNLFFQSLRGGTAEGFRSELDVALIQ